MHKSQFFLFGLYSMNLCFLDGENSLFDTLCANELSPIEKIVIAKMIILHKLFILISHFFQLLFQSNRLLHPAALAIHQLDVLHHPWWRGKSLESRLLIFRAFRLFRSLELSSISPIAVE